MKEILSAASTTPSSSSPLIGKVVEVNNVSGDASVVVSRGKKRYVFDLTCELKFEIVDAEDDSVLGKGSMELPDISSTAASDGDWEVQMSWKKGRNSANVKALGDDLAEEVRGSLTSFVKVFNSEF